jgi:hypothetical protein
MMMMMMVYQNHYHDYFMMMILVTISIGKKRLEIPPEFVPDPLGEFDRRLPPPSSSPPGTTALQAIQAIPILIVAGGFPKLVNFGLLIVWLFFVAYSTDHEWPAAHVISPPDRCSSHLWRSEMSAASGKI